MSQRAIGAVSSPPPAEDTTSTDTPGPLRVCLDLNIFVSDFVAGVKQRVGTVTQRLVTACRTGVIGERPVQLIISLPMLDRYAMVLMREFDVPPDVATDVAEAIAEMARAHATEPPNSGGPLLVLGGTGVLPVRDIEDRGVLETAIAGQAEYLITNNMRDFVPPALWTQEPEIAQYERITIIRPYAFAQQFNI